LPEKDLDDFQKTPSFLFGKNCQITLEAKEAEKADLGYVFKSL